MEASESPLLDRPVFEVQGQTWCWREVLLATRGCADWAELERVVRAQLACRACLDDDGVTVAEEDVMAEAAAFRTARNLDKAEDTEQWLEYRGLSVDSWLDCLRDSLLRRRHAAELPDWLEHYPAAPESILEVLLDVAVCEGFLQRFAQKLAGRAAVAALAGGSDNSTAEEQAPFLPDDAFRTWLGLSEVDCRNRAEQFARFEKAFAAFSGQLLTDQEIRRQVNTRRLEWIRIACSRVSFPEVEMAKEALLCIRQDGDDLPSVAGMARVPLLREQFYLDELPSDQQSIFLGSRKGDLLGPIQLDSEHRIYLIEEKILASTEAPDIRRKAEMELLRQAVDREIRARVKWS